MASELTVEDSIANVHPCYTDAEEEWQTIEDLCDGPRQVKRRGERYLPKLQGQQEIEYRSYRDRATFVNFTKRTREAMVGMLLRKTPEIEKPSSIEDLTADVTLGGHTIRDWLRMIGEQSVSTGRSCTVVDFSADEGRPYFSHYRACDVLNWASERVAGVERLKMITVREHDEQVDGFTVEQVTKIRRYWIPDEGEGAGFVQCDLWRQESVEGGGKTGTGTDQQARWQQAGETIQMARNGKPLTKIPAIFHNASHLGPEIGEAPLYDIAEINVSHYRTSADLENGRHVCGLPTPYATGVEGGEDLQLGATKAWTSEDPAAKFGFIEFTGQGLGALTDAMKEKAEQMATLGARMLFNENREAEAYETVQLRANSETAALSNIAGHMSATCSQALQWFIWWMTPGTERPEDIEASIVINQDFTAAQMKPDQLNALVSALQTQSISPETFYYQLEKGEIYPDDWDLERETAAIGQAAPKTPPVKAQQGTGGPTGGPGGNQGGSAGESGSGAAGSA